MFTQSYRDAIEHIASVAPPVEKATAFIKWAEDICSLLCFIYNKDYDDVTENIFTACKEEQGYESDDEEE